MSEENKKNTCYSYHSGHHLHYIAHNRAGRDREPVEVIWLEDYTYQVTRDGITEIWYHHSKDEIKNQLSLALQIEAPKDRTWLMLKFEHFGYSYNLTNEPLTACVTEQASLKLEGDN